MKTKKKEATSNIYNQNEEYNRKKSQEDKKNRLQTRKKIEKQLDDHVKHNILV